MESVAHHFRIINIVSEKYPIIFDGGWTYSQFLFLKTLPLSPKRDMIFTTQVNQ